MTRIILLIILYYLSLFGLAGLLWVLVPSGDTKSSKRLRNRKINYKGLFAIGFIIVLTIGGWIS